MTNRSSPTERLCVCVEPEVMDDLRSLAQRNDRSVSAEVRLALREHVAATSREERVAESPQNLLTINQVAAYLGVQRGTVYRLVAAGDLRTVEVGKRLRFKPEDVDVYLERDEVRR